MQLYAIQEIAANTHVVPLEWALSLSLGGIALLLPTGIFLFKGMINALNQKTLEAPDPF
jgi:F0F1-type ATP synthase assembly protein I